MTNFQGLVSPLQWLSRCWCFIVETIEKEIGSSQEHVPKNSTSFISSIQIQNYNHTSFMMSYSSIDYIPLYPMSFYFFSCANFQIQWTLFFFAKQRSNKQGSVYSQPRHYWGEIPHNYHTFASSLILPPKKMGPIFCSLLNQSWFWRFKNMWWFWKKNRQFFGDLQRYPKQTQLQDIIRVRLRFRRRQLRLARQLRLTSACLLLCPCRGCRVGMWYNIYVYIVLYI